MKNIKELMKWRFACKNFDPNKKIDRKTLEDLLDTARLSPSSSGLQSWKFVVVTNQEIREKLKEPGHNQSQITEASALVFLCADLNVLGAKGSLERYAQDLEKMGRSEEKLEKFKNSLNKRLTNMGEAKAKIWLQKQVYIPMMVLILAAAEQGIDSCPMEGFEAEGIARVLNLPENLVPTVLVSLGYRAGEAPVKNRVELEKIVEFRD
jgi:nitroreductase/dihydropteridine reductase